MCCTTRQLEACEQFAERFAPESKGSAKAVIDQLWEAVVGNSSEKTNWEAVQKEVMELLPEEQDQWAPFHVYADHAIASLAYTIRCLLKPDAQEAAWSARRAYEAADQAAIRDLDVQTGAADSEARILAHPIVQRELQRQQRDLRLLQSSPLEQSLNALKASAFSEPMLSLSEMLR
ncbi:MAG: DUF416 family protein [Candidatus Competibacterales bacterium]